MLALAGRGLRVFGLLSAAAALGGVRIDAFQRPLLIAACYKVPDLGLCTVGGVHATRSMYLSASTLRMRVRPLRVGSSAQH